MLSKSQIIGIAVLLVAWVNIGIVQVDNTQDLLRAGVEDANLLITEYLRPVGNGFSADLNNGWYRTARPHQFLGFDIMVMATDVNDDPDDNTEVKANGVQVMGGIMFPLGGN